MALVKSVLSAKAKSFLTASGAFGVVPGASPEVAAMAEEAAVNFSDGLADWLIDVLKNDLQVQSTPVLVSPPGVSGGPVTGTITNTQL